MKMTRLLFAFVVAGSFAFAAVDINKPIAELTLKDGRLLKSVEIVSFASSSVMAKWEGGRGTIPYDSFPAEYKDALVKMRPAAKSPAPPTTLSAPSAEQRVAAELARQAKAKAGAEAQAKQDAYVKDLVEREAWAKRVSEAISNKHLIVGMTEAEASQAWGQPDKINKSGGAYGSTAQWIYVRGQRVTDRIYVYFDNGKLTSWQTSQ